MLILEFKAEIEAQGDLIRVLPLNSFITRSMSSSTVNSTFQQRGRFLSVKILDLAMLMPCYQV
jgi:hypothetical protein